MKTIIKNGKIIDTKSNSIVEEDIYIKDGLISEPFKLNSKDIKVIDAKNMFLLSGLCDLHVHFRDPGQTKKEDILSGSKAAARGGFTTVCLMPNTNPPVDSVDTLKYVDNKGRNGGLVNILQTSAMTINQEGKALCDFELLDDTNTLCKELTGHGVAAITEDGMTLSSKKLMEDVCKKAASLDLLVMDHAEPEVEVVKRDIELSRKYGTRIHIQHVSQAESVDLIRKAKEERLPITAEATPHHFVLNESAVKEFGVNAKMNPPLTSESNRMAVVNGLLDGTIDIIATDHAPHTHEEKDVAIEEAPNGIVGLETAFAIAYTYLVKNGSMTLNELARKMSARPEEIIGLKPNYLMYGNRADIVIVDLEKEYEINKENFVSKGRNTPFHGMSVYGRVEKTIHNGQITWEEQQ